MINFKKTIVCMQVNFQKWPINLKMYMIAFLIPGFLMYHLSGFSDFAAYNDLSIHPWIFAHITTPPVMQIFLCFAFLLFSDAPFVDRHMPFLVIRSGGNNWVIGQLLYIALAAFIFTIFVFLVSLLVLIPNVTLKSGWGVYISSLAANSLIAPENVTVFFNESIISYFTPLNATLISLFLFWIVTLFIGITIFCFNVVIGKFSGIIITGTFIFLSYFVVYLGNLNFGEKVYYFSPLSWISMSYIDWNSNGGFPAFTYVLFSLIVGIIIMSTLTIVIFNKKDIDISDWGYGK